MSWKFGVILHIEKYIIIHVLTPPPPPLLLPLGFVSTFSYCLQTCC